MSHTSQANGGARAPPGYVTGADSTKAAVIEMIFWFTPDHWNAKAE